MAQEETNKRDDEQTNEENPLDGQAVPSGSGDPDDGDEIDDGCGRGEGEDKPNP